jgi:hypothetical protein
MIRSRRNVMNRLGALTNIVASTNANSNIPLNIEEMLTSFSNHVATRDDGEEADINNADNEAGNVVVVIPDLLDKSVKRKVEKYRNKVAEKALELAPLQESRNDITDQLKKTREYLSLLKKQVRDGQSNRRRARDGLEPKLFEVLRTIGVELT